MVGNTIIIIMMGMVLTQIFLQGSARQKEHRELMDRLDQLEAKLGRSS